MFTLGTFYPGPRQAIRVAAPDGDAGTYGDDCDPTALSEGFRSTV